MDDRILVVPPNWAPGPDDNDALAGATALRRRLERVLPVDVFAWPTLKGVPLRGEGNAGLLNAFRDGLLTGAIAATPEFYEQLLKAIGSHRVNQRPGRVEPRAKKRRRKNYPLLTEPRAKARQRLQCQET